MRNHYLVLIVFMVHVNCDEIKLGYLAGMNKFKTRPNV